MSRVLNGQFLILNGYNAVPITKKAWRAGIQPKVRVSMAMMLESEAVREGRCASPSCTGQIELGIDEVTKTW